LSAAAVKNVLSKKAIYFLLEKKTVDKEGVDSAERR